jgi:precorrin-3B methylase
MDSELQNQTNAPKREERREWVRPEVSKINAGAAEAGAAVGGDFGTLS